MQSPFYLLGISICAGILLGIGSSFSSLWWCSLFSFLPLMYALERTKNARSTFVYALIMGLCAYGLTFRALFWDSLPLTWLGVDGWQSIFLIFLIWFITVSLFALVFALVLTLVRSQFLLNRWTDLLIVPSAYVVAEWLATWGFSIVNYGPFALLGPNFTMGSPAYQLAANEALLQFAWIGGIYALSFIQAFIGVVVYRILVVQAQKEKAVIATLLFLFLAYAIFASVDLSRSSVRETTNPLRVALVNTYEPSILAPSAEQNASSFAKLSHFVTSVASSSIAVIALPEDSRFLEQWHALNPPFFAAPIEGARTHALVIDSASVHEDGSLYSRTEYFDPVTGASTYSYKQFLMPLGEEHPYIYQWLLKLVGQGNLVDSLLTVRGFHTKPLVQQQVVQGVPIIALLCSEGMGPLFYVSEARKGAEVFFNLSSHSWFHESHAMHAISLWNSKVRAVESRRYYARSGNDSPAFILDPYGRVSALMQWNTEGVLYGTVYARHDVTPYMIFGQFVLLFPLSILCYAYLKKRILRSHGD